MRKRNVGVLAGLVIGVILLFASFAFSEVLTWTPETTTTLGDSFSSEEMATMKYYVRIDKPNPMDNWVGINGFYYIGEVVNTSFFPADNLLASLMRSYGFGGTTVKFTVSQAFKDTDGVERDSAQSEALTWLVPPVQLEVASMPTFSPAAGNYTTDQSVTISTSTAGASIRFTTDGSTPSATVGTVYTYPIPVSAGTTTIKAVAYKAGMDDSTLNIGTYIVTTPFRPRTPAAPGVPVVR